MSKKSKTIVGVVLVITVLLIAVGYAAIGNITLNITGSASGTGNTSNFVVKFSDIVNTAITGTVTTNSKVASAAATGKITGDRAATITVTGLATKGDYADVSFKVANNSKDIKATIAATAKSNNTDFSVAVIAGTGTAVAAGSTTTITVRVTLNKTLVGDSSTNVTVNLTATPSN